MLEVKDLHIHFHDADAAHDAVKGISFTVPDGEIVGLVGESGSGKSITAMAVCGLLPRHRASLSGEVMLNGKNLLTIPRSELRAMQGSDITVVFQEPMVSLDPCMKIGPQVEEALLLHTDLGDEERKARALKAMADADLPDPERLYNKYPHELSGGMLQRCMIAAAIISDPQLLLCDEPTTALDVTIQAEILKLLQRINKEKGTSILFISHNLNVVKKLCTSILVMHKGLLVERGTPEEIFNHPREEYTKRLIAAIPSRTRKIRDMVDAERAAADKTAPDGNALVGNAPDGNAPGGNAQGISAETGNLQG